MDYYDMIYGFLNKDDRKFMFLIRKVLTRLMEADLLKTQFNIDVCSYRILNILKNPDFSRLYYKDTLLNKTNGRPKKVNE